MKQMLKDWIIAIGLGVVVYLVIGWIQPKPDLPGQAPLFSVQTLDGETFDLAAKQGRPVVINFWASWCGPCRAEIPDFSRFADKHPDVAMIGLAVDSGSTSKVRRSAKEFGIRYPVAIADASIKSRYDVSTLPTTVVVAPDGSVSHIEVGKMSYRDLTRAAGSAQP